MAKIRCSDGMVFGLLSLVGQGVLIALGAAEGPPTGEVTTEPARAPAAAAATSAAQVFFERRPEPVHIGLCAVLPEVRLAAPVLAGSESPILVELTNTGATPISLTDVRLGCACGRVIACPSSIDAAGHAVVRLAYQAGQRTGEARHMVEVLSSDAARPRLKIPVVFTVVAPVDLSPAALDFGAIPAEAGSGLASAASSVRTVTITIRQPEAVVIHRVHSANPWILPVLQEVERGRRYIVSVTLAPTAPAGPIQGQVVLDADADVSGRPPSLPIAFAVSGRVESP